MVFFGFFGLSGFFVWILVYKCCLFDWNLVGGIWNCSSWEIKVRISSEININITFIWTVTNLVHGSKRKMFMKSSSARGNFSIETLVGEIITFCYWEMWVWISRLFKHFLTFWLSRLWWKDQKYFFFNRIIVYKCQVFAWGFDGKKQAYNCWEIIVWISIKFIISTFYSFMTDRILIQGTKSILFQ